MARKKKKIIDLALQGGGAHGAFTWGILDRFLEKDIFTFEGLSATSAGSMNAVVLAQGMMEGGNDGARELLHKFWKSMSDYGKIFSLAEHTVLDAMLQQFSKDDSQIPLSFYVFSAFSGIFTPYQFNPLNFHPLREVLSQLIDVEKLRAQSPIKLFICATNVKTGKIRIFNNEELSIDAVLASACLPKLFQAVKVGEDYFWDGGYMGNPAIFPLIYNTKTPDILILHTVPIVRDQVPVTMIEIETRLREISFNSSLLREMRAIAFVSKLLEEEWLKKEYQKRLKMCYIHTLRADRTMLQFSYASVLSCDWNFLVKLRDLGREKADEWLDRNYKYIGKKSSIDFNEWL